MRPLAYIGAIAAAIIIGASGGGAPGITINPGGVAFGSQDVALGATPAQPVTVTNTTGGAAPLQISSVALTGVDASQFQIVSDPCGGAIGSSCPISVAFDPLTSGSKTAALTITDNAPGSPHSVALTGIATTAGGAGLANVWVDTNGGTCVYSATPAAYVDATACPVAALNGFTGGLANVNTSGGSVALASGTYALAIHRNLVDPPTTKPTVTITGDTTMPDQFTCATNTCATGSVIATDLDVCGGNLLVQDFDIVEPGDGSGGPFESYAPQSCGANPPVDNHDIVIDNVHSGRGAILGTNITVEHSRFGPITDECNVDLGHADGDLLHSWVWATTPNDITATNVTVDHSVIWWNQIGPECGSSDSDTWQMLGVHGLTFTNNIIGACTNQNWTDGSLNGSTETGDILVANNFFNGIATPLSNCVGSQLGGFPPPACSTTSWVIEYNTFATNKATVANSLNQGCPGVVVRDNYFEREPGGATTCNFGSWDHNVYATTSPAACGTNATLCTARFSNPDIGTPVFDAWDLHPAHGDTCMNSGGTATVFMPTDIDGTTRPAGSVGAAVVP